jgi:transglutaminase-like putative cysteine protease
MNAVPEALAGWTELEVVHETRYRYSAPVSLAHHLAHLEPLVDAHQRLLDFQLDVQPVPSRPSSSVDAFGNACRHFTHAQPHDKLVVRACSRVQVAARFSALDAGRSPAWEAIRDRLRYVARAPFDPAVEFAQPSPFVPRLDPLRATASTPISPTAPRAPRSTHRWRRPLHSAPVCARTSRT